MPETSLSLLNRLQQSATPEGWDRLVGLYGPLLTTWLRKYGVQASDADDLVQDVLLTVSNNLKSFDHNGRPGAFRAWLRSILVNRLRNFWRARDRRPQAPGDADIDRQLMELQDPGSSMSQLWNRQHDQHILRNLIELTKPQFAPETWIAFNRVAMNGERADIVAAEMGISINAVFIAKSRVLSSLRRQAAGLIESSQDFPMKS
jgi:RNA polymerase sigma factor (sigma-70 family)